MKENNLFLGVIVEETTSISFVEVCHKYRINQDLLLEMIDYGLLSAQINQDNQASIDQKSLQRMETAFRLHRDLEINLAGVALALDLLDEMKDLRSELDILRKQV